MSEFGWPFGPSTPSQETAAKSPRAQRAEFAQSEQLPAVVAKPPWVPARKRPKLDLPELPPREERIVWAAKEREEWADPSPGVGPDKDKFAAMPADERDREILS